VTRPCSVCTHPDRAAIDAALVNRTSYRDISGQYRVSRSALSRHAEHIPSRLTAASAAADVARADTLLGQVQSLRDRALSLLDRAERDGDLRAAIVALRETRNTVELLAKIAGELNDAPTVNVVTSPDWCALRTTLLNALEPFPDARAAAAAALLAAG
jgi:hypothetical protein